MLTKSKDKLEKTLVTFVTGKEPTSLTYKGFVEIGKETINYNQK